jgi:hypothetical protein
MGKSAALRGVGVLAALFFGLTSFGQLAAQSPTSVTLVKAGRLLDPRTGNVLSPAAVLIERRQDQGSRFAFASGKRMRRPASRLIDLGGATLLPGLIDSHTHLLLDVTLPTEAESTRRDPTESLFRGCCWRSPCRPVNAYCWARSWRAKTWRVVLPLCAISGTPAWMAMLRCATRSTQAASGPENSGLRA